jgi:hypothetical protein
LCILCSMFIKIWFHTLNEFLHVNLDSFPSNSLTFFSWKFWFSVIWFDFRKNAQPLNKSFTMNVKLRQKKTYMWFTCITIRLHVTRVTSSTPFVIIIIIDRFIDHKYHFTLYFWIVLIRFLALNHLLYFHIVWGLCKNNLKWIEVFVPSSFTTL